MWSKAYENTQYFPRLRRVRTHPLPACHWHCQRVEKENRGFVLAGCTCTLRIRALSGSVPAWTRPRAALQPPRATPVLAVRACGMPNGGHARGQSGPRRWRGPPMATRSARAPRPRGCARGALRGRAQERPRLPPAAPAAAHRSLAPGSAGGAGAL